MENRFGIKDFFIFTLLIAVLVLVGLSMKEFDRQWQSVQDLKRQVSDAQSALNRLESLQDNLDAIQKKLDGMRLSAASGNSTSATRAANSADDLTNNTAATTKSFSAGDPTATADPHQNPFARILAAQAMPGYARGDWCVDAFGGDVAKLTPLLSGDTYAADIQNYVLESLMTRDPDTLGWRPLLAQGAPQVSKDGLVITFTMRDNLRFSDGEPLTADDVVFTYNFIENPKIAAPRDRAAIDKIASVKKEGTNKVVFTFREPFFQSFELAASFQVLPQHFYGKFAPEDFNLSVGYLMGSGPYKMEDPKGWKPGIPIQLVRNEHYWGVAPAFNRLLFREITNDKARLIAFSNGDVDRFGAAPEQYRQMLKDTALVNRTRHFEYLSPMGGYNFVGWNQLRDGKPTRFADKRVRQAMAMLVNRAQLIRQVTLGYAVAATGPFSPLSKQCDPSVKPWPYDVDAAKKLLVEAGFSKTNDEGVLVGPDDTPFEFKLTYPSGSTSYEKMVLFLKDSYAAAGIKLDPDPMQWGAFTEKLEKRDFDAISLGWSAGLENDIYQMFDSKEMVQGGDDFISYKNPQLDAAIEEARGTVDEASRMPIWHTCHRILHEDQPYMFLWFGKSLAFIDQRIHNVQITKVGMNDKTEWFVPRNMQHYTR